MRISRFMTSALADLTLVLVLLAGRSAVRAAGEVLAVDVARWQRNSWAPTAGGEAARVGERDCRVARSGKDACFAHQPGGRMDSAPPKGSTTLRRSSTRTRLQAGPLQRLGGLRRNESRSEMHRFGGLKDGKWKTVQVPLGWDVLMVRPGTRMVEFSIDSKDGDVAVASIRVMPLASKDLPKAAERWNTDTRAWVPAAADPL